MQIANGRAAGGWRRMMQYTDKNAVRYSSNGLMINQKMHIDASYSKTSLQCIEHLYPLKQLSNYYIIIIYQFSFCVRHP